MAQIRSQLVFPLPVSAFYAHHEHLSSLRRVTEEASSLRVQGTTVGDSVSSGAGNDTCPSQANGEEGVISTSVCLPRAVAPDIAPVILAFLYTDRLDPDSENAPAGFAEEYLDPEIGGAWSGLAAPAPATESCRPRGRSGYVGDRCEFGSSDGAATIMERSTDLGVARPSKVRISCRHPRTMSQRRIAAIYSFSDDFFRISVRLVRMHCWITHDGENKFVRDHAGV